MAVEPRGSARFCWRRLSQTRWRTRGTRRQRLGDVCETLGVRLESAAQVLLVQLRSPGAPGAALTRDRGAQGADAVGAASRQAPHSARAGVLPAGTLQVHVAGAVSDDRFAATACRTAARRGQVLSQALSRCSQIYFIEIILIVESTGVQTVQCRRVIKVIK